MTNITISQEGIDPIKISISDNNTKSKEGIGSKLFFDNLSQVISDIGDAGGSGFVFKSISDLKKNERVLSLMDRIKNDKDRVYKTVSQNDLIKLDPKYFGRHNTWEVNGITIAKFNTTSLIGAITKNYKYKVYIVLLEADNKSYNIKLFRFATINEKLANALNHKK